MWDHSFFSKRQNLPLYHAIVLEVDFIHCMLLQMNPGLDLEAWKAMIQKMRDARPEKRPKATEVFAFFRHLGESIDLCTGSL